eukprot:TRINITY_DN7251_c0_g1_i10.p1 TRINITY_DN7251_c0_g1~~TRINITY_DN7251_c0_g1_i10.p1  ORF type:complete len:219 (-),score=44.29 TRINITY_DN7251_c0_g1_i10:341-997(-)
MEKKQKKTREFYGEEKKKQRTANKMDTVDLYWCARAKAVEYANAQLVRANERLVAENFALKAQIQELQEKVVRVDPEAMSEADRRIANFLAFSVGPERTVTARGPPKVVLELPTRNRRSRLIQQCVRLMIAIASTLRHQLSSLPTVAAHVSARAEEIRQAAMGRLDHHQVTFQMDNLDFLHKRSLFGPENSGDFVHALNSVMTFFRSPPVRCKAETAD